MFYNYIIPYGKEFLLIVIILICFWLVTSYTFMFSRYMFSNKSYSTDNEYLKKKETFNLKGRIKRTPNNINYNELFVENIVNEKGKKKRKNEEK